MEETIDMKYVKASLYNFLNKVSIIAGTKTRLLRVSSTKLKSNSVSLKELEPSSHHKPRQPDLQRQNP